MQNIANYFLGIGAKRLSEVEIHADTSHQHELNGINDFKNIFGSDLIRFKTRFLFLSDEEEKLISDEGVITWYDSRENHPKRSEYRLYYTTNDAILQGQPGDLIIVCRLGEDSCLVIVARKGTTTERQLLWLFNLSEVENKFIVKDLSHEKQSLGFAAKYIISTLGIQIEETEPDFLEIILKKFGETFPSTKVFSEFSRSTTTDFPIIEDPDEALIMFLEREEILFKTLEKHLLEKKLKTGFGSSGIDVDEFIQFSLSVQNRRKSRAGYSFENHLEYIFNTYKLKYTKKAKTERNNEPDFIFPGTKEYNDKSYDDNLLRMLAVKTSVKERWTQILTEADRIWPKHLITLEPSISKNQTDEMIAQKVELVLPKSLFKTYSVSQQSNFLTLHDFIRIVKV